jgi:hypothetical protein
VSNHTLFLHTHITWFGQDPSGNDTLWLPDDDILGNGDITGMMNLAHSKRAEYSTRKSIAEHRLRLCEKEIGSLRQDVADADRDLPEVDMKFAALRRILHNPNSSANTSWDQQNHGTSPYRSNISDYSSDSSSMGSSSKD